MAMTVLEQTAHKLGQYSYFYEMEEYDNSVHFTYGMKSYAIFPPNEECKKWEIYKIRPSNEDDILLMGRNSFETAIKHFLETN